MRRIGVSPARAGMVPQRPVLQPQRPRFPRASGDGPSQGIGAGAVPQFPPRERGWSHTGGAAEGCRAVSPARAGMVPGKKAELTGKKGFPRASGDGPCSISVPRLAGEFPPRERGWSLSGANLSYADLVSPARAGMVPDPASPRSILLGFPRASGDGPLDYSEGVNADGFPPRERGWSFLGASRIYRTRVSPARAGMVPNGCWLGTKIYRFPRASGDGPCLQLSMGQPRRFPPRERGWSRNVLRNESGSSVSPARAGMVP